MLGLARALYKKPQLLLLDESTSALDSKSETFITNLLIKIRHHTTVLLITHDKKLKDWADRSIDISNMNAVA